MSAACSVSSSLGFSSSMLSMCYCISHITNTQCFVFFKVCCPSCDTLLPSQQSVQCDQWANISGDDEANSLKHCFFLYNLILKECDIRKQPDFAIKSGPRLSRRQLPPPHHAHRPRYGPEEHFYRTRVRSLVMLVTN